MPEPKYVITMGAQKDICMQDISSCWSVQDAFEYAQKTYKVPWQWSTSEWRKKCMPVEKEAKMKKNIKKWGM